MQTRRPNDEQSALWNGPSGRAWVETQALIDRMFEPLERLLVEEVATSSARSVLDVGCGTGAVTVAIARRLGAPGQFGFGDRQRIASVLADSGWADVAIEPVELACALPATALDDYITRLGPVGLALLEVDDATRRRVVDTMRAAFEPYVDGADVRFDAACWLVTARAPSA